MHTAMSTLRAAASLRRLAASTPRPPLMGIAATSTPHTSAARRTYYALGVAPEPFHPIPNKHPREMTAEEAVEHIHDGENVYIHTGAAAPYSLVTALANYGRNRAPRPLHVRLQLCSGACYVLLGVARTPILGSLGTG